MRSSTHDPHQELTWLIAFDEERLFNGSADLSENLGPSVAARPGSMRIAWSGVNKSALASERMAIIGRTSSLRLQIHRIAACVSTVNLGSVQPSDPKPLVDGFRAPIV